MRLVACPGNLQNDGSGRGGAISTSIPGHAWSWRSPTLASLTSIAPAPPGFSAH